MCRQDALSLMLLQSGEATRHRPPTKGAYILPRGRSYLRPVGPTAGRGRSLPRVFRARGRAVLHVLSRGAAAVFLKLCLWGGIYVYIEYMPCARARRKDASFSLSLYIYIYSAPSAVSYYEKVRTTEWVPTRETFSPRVSPSADDVDGPRRRVRVLPRGRGLGEGAGFAPFSFVLSAFLLFRSAFLSRGSLLTADAAGPAAAAEGGGSLTAAEGGGSFAAPCCSCCRSCHSRHCLQYGSFSSCSLRSSTLPHNLVQHVGH